MLSSLRPSQSRVRAAFSSVTNSFLVFPDALYNVAAREVYFYEYNNHECMIDWDGDLSAIRIIIDIWGVAIAEKITRFSAGLTMADIIAKQK